MTVSIIIPNFNNASYLRQCIESVIGDPAVDEIVIYDNGSTDNSIAVIGSFGSPKIQLLRGSENLGATLGRHRAVEASCGAYICYLDADDFLSPDAVSLALEAARANDLDLSIFRLINVDAAGRNPTVYLEPPKTLIDGKEACGLTLGGWHIHPLGLIRRSVYDAAWTNFTPHGYSDDELLTRHILLAAARVCGNSGCYFYRRLAKPAHPRREHDVMMTALSVLDIGIAAGLPQPVLRRQRNMAVRFAAGMVRRRLLGRANASQLANYYRRLAASKILWQAGDWRYLLLYWLLAVLTRPSRSPE